MTRSIPLTRGFVAIVDDEDYDKVSRFKWHAKTSKRSVYAARAIPNPQARGPRQTLLYLHHVITGYPRVDHRDGDGLNNRRENLRAATMTQNNQNRRASRTAASRFKGVFTNSGFTNSGRGLPWKAGIKVGARSIHLGYFGSEDDAARAYDAAAREHFGEWAAVNFPAAGERPAVDWPQWTLEAPS